MHSICILYIYYTNIVHTRIIYIYILYAFCTHIIFILFYPYYTQIIRILYTYYTHMMRILYAYYTHIICILYTYYTRIVRILYADYTHSIRILSAYYAHIYPNRMWLPFKLCTAWSRLHGTDIRSPGAGKRQPPKVQGAQELAVTTKDFLSISQGDPLEFVGRIFRMLRSPGYPGRLWCSSLYRTIVDLPGSRWIKPNPRLDPTHLVPQCSPPQCLKRTPARLTPSSTAEQHCPRPAGFPPQDLKRTPLI